MEFHKKLNGKKKPDIITKKKIIPKARIFPSQSQSNNSTLNKNKYQKPNLTEKQFKDREKYEKEDAAVRELVKELEVDIPSGMIEMEVDNMMRDMEQRMSYQGLKLEQYLKMLNKTEEEFRNDYEPQAVEAIKSRLALEAIIKAEKIEATENDVKEKLEEMAKNYGKTAEELEKNENIKEYIKQGIESEKAINFLVENAKEVAKKNAK